MLSERIESTIERWTGKWKDRLRGWMASWVMRGVTELMESLEPEAIETISATLATVRDHPATSQNIKDVIGVLLAGKKPLPLLLIIPIAVLMFIPTITAIAQPLGNLLRYQEDKRLHSYRVDPFQVITAWRRDKPTYEWLFDDLKDQGWSEARIEALKFATEYMPTPQQIIAWLAHEVFEPEMIERYGLDSEFEALDLTIPRKIGMTDEMALNEWRNHWQHASWNQVVEMVRRGQMTEEDVWDWFRLVEIPPFWRQKLINISWEVPTRVDVRRFYDLKTIDEARLREIYTAQGYHGKDLDDYVLWTKIYVGLPDLLARWKNGWITLDDVRSELLNLGMKEEAADELIQTKVKAVEPTSTAEGKELTKTEIYKGVKAGYITPDQGVDLIMDLDYSRDQAEYLLAINVATLAGSPEKFSEFKDLTEKHRKAAGMEVKAMPEELKKAADEVVRLTKEVASLNQAIKEEEGKLIELEPRPPEAEARLKELQVTRNRAIAELERVKAEYDRLLAEWKHAPA